MGRTQGGGCESWTVIRHLIGPRRWGVVAPINPAFVSAFYKGDCAWDIVLIQEGIQREFVLYEEVQVTITKCGATVSESAGAVVVGPEWRAVRIKRVFISQRVLRTVIALDPSGLPCGEDRSWLGVPAEVRAAADAEAERGQHKRGIDVPVGPPLPPKPVLPPRPPYTGPYVSPVPPPPDDHAWFWIWWALGGWMIEPDPPWEPPGQHEVPHHGYERPEAPLGPIMPPTTGMGPR